MYFKYIIFFFFFFQAEDGIRDKLVTGVQTCALPISSAILTEVGGKIAFRDILEGENLREETDRVTGLAQKIIVETVGAEKRSPQVLVQGKSGERKYLLPIGSHIMISDGQELSPGDVLAKIPRETTKTKDIPGGLPRIVELFEARRPK